VKNWWASDTSLKDNAMEASDATDSFVRNHAGVSDQVLKVTAAEMATLNIERDAFHPEWNYTIAPRDTSHN
jgi:hypothetical protein